MKIIWARQTKKEKKKPVDPQTPKDPKAVTQSKLTDKESEETLIFSITPAEVNLNAKMGIMVEVRANSPQTGKLLE